MKDFFSKNLENENKSQEKNRKELLWEDPHSEAQIGVTRGSSKSNLEKESYENLKKYIAELIKMQNEKE